MWENMAEEKIEVGLGGKKCFQTFGSGLKFGLGKQSLLGKTGLNKSARGPLTRRPCATRASEFRFASERLTFFKEREEVQEWSRTWVNRKRSRVGAWDELAFSSLTRGKSHTASSFHSCDEEPPENVPGCFSFFLYVSVSSVCL